LADATIYQPVKDALAPGRTHDEITIALFAAGWEQDQIHDALNAFAEIDFPMSVPRPLIYGSAREALLYTVYFAQQGMVAIYLGRLSFSWIEYIFSDELKTRSWRSGMTGLHRGSPRP